MDITWQDSGKGPIDLPLASVHHLAIQAGFVFDIDDSQPLSKRANLQKLFDRFNVNSLTAFKQKFFTYQLNPHLGTDNSSSRPVWTTQELLSKINKTGTDQYIGQLVHNKPHGHGILLTRGATSPYIYIGTFENGLQNGYGIILTPRGESFHGFFKDGETYGPGSYTFPRPRQSIEEQEEKIDNENNVIKRHRVRFDGMHNGRPYGLGVVVWSDGVRESGEFDGMQLKRHVALEECQGVLLVAAQNAEMAKRVASETEDEMKRRSLWEGQAEVLIQKFDSGALQLS